METNETMTPEDVARDYEAVNRIVVGATGTTRGGAAAALSRLATAAARVPGLEQRIATMDGALVSLREYVKGVESERDAARQETEKHRKGLQDVLLECSNFREENARLTARVAELERQGTADWNACCDALAWARSFRSDLPSPNRAVVAVIERLTTAEAMRRRVEGVLASIAQKQEAAGHDDVATVLDVARELIRALPLE